MNKEPINTKKKDDVAVELESEVILRLPPVVAQELRKVIRSGANNLKDRLTIQLENDMRHGTVRFDNWVLSAKVLDLPCVLESHKTIDKKTFYKAADICQIIVCKEEDDSQTTEEEEPAVKKKDKKDIIKVDKKFLFPHGITPPLKNVRKRRFRKTLKKKYVDAPEIEKEVKRLFRVDNDAVKVSWELISDAEDAIGSSKGIGKSMAEHDIFGEAVSSSEDEGDVNIIDSGDDDTSRISSGVPSQRPRTTKKDLVTEFTKGMLRKNASSPEEEIKDDYISALQESARLVQSKQGDKSHHDVPSQEAVIEKLNSLRQQLVELRARRVTQELEIASIENLALKQRFQSILDNIVEEEKEKQRQCEELLMAIQP